MPPGWSTDVPRKSSRPCLAVQGPHPMSASTRLMSLPPAAHSLTSLAVGSVHLRLMVGKTVIGGMKVTYCMDEDVGAGEGRPVTLGCGRGYSSWPPALFSTHPKEIRRPGTNRLVPGYAVSTWSPLDTALSPYLSQVSLITFLPSPVSSPCSKLSFS